MRMGRKLDNENSQEAIKKMVENAIKTLVGTKGYNIQNAITEALESILKARKEALDKFDNKPENIIYSIEAAYIGQLFKFIIGILEESGNEPITPSIAANWQDKYGVVIEFYDQGE